MGIPRACGCFSLWDGLFLRRGCELLRSVGRRRGGTCCRLRQTFICVLWRATPCFVVQCSPGERSGAQPGALEG